MEENGTIRNNNFGNCEVAWPVTSPSVHDHFIRFSWQRGISLEYILIMKNNELEMVINSLWAYTCDFEHENELPNQLGQACQIHWHYV